MVNILLVLLLNVASLARAENDTASSQHFAQESLKQAEAAKQEALRYLEGQFQQPATSHQQLETHASIDSKKPFLWSSEETSMPGDSNQKVAQKPASAFALKQPSTTLTQGRVCRRKTCGGSSLAESEKENALRKDDAKQEQPKTSDIIVFVSFSMSDESLKGYAQDLQRAGGRLVVRGLINDSFKATQERLTRLGIELDIDPVLFEDFSISHVPAFLILKDGKETDRLTGHVSLEHALEEFADDGNDIAKTALTKLREEVPPKLDLNNEKTHLATATSEEKP